MERPLFVWTLGAALSACAGAADTGMPRAGDGSSDGVDSSTATSGDMAQKSVDLAKNDAGAPPVGGCNPASQTLGASGGPDICAYGKTCSAATGTCVPPPSGACAMSMGAPAWNTTSAVAPVITKITATLLASTNSMTECANGDPAALVDVQFYAPSFLTSQDVVNAFLSQVQFKKSDLGTGSWFGANFVRAMPVKSQHFGSFQVGINCGGAGGSVKTAAMYIVDEAGRDSNVACVSW